MNPRGFFCFVLLLSFISIEAGFLANSGNAREELGDAAATAFEAERLSLQRSLLEESLDNAVEGALEEGLSQELGPGRIKELVNSRLARLFSEAEYAYGGLEFGHNAKSTAFLNGSSSVMVARLGRKNVQASYFFSGGIARADFVLGTLKGKAYRAEFRVPPGYTASATVAE